MSLETYKTYNYEDISRNALEEYAKKAWSYKKFEDNSYLFYALHEEFGELMGLFAKSIRAKIPVDVEKVKLELGDIMWNISGMAIVYGLKIRTSGEYQGVLTPSYISDLADRWNMKLVSGKSISRAIDFVRCVAVMFDIKMQDILDANIAKLEARRAAGTLSSTTRE